MAFGQTRRILRFVLGCAIILGPAEFCRAQSRGDGQSSTRISGPLNEGLDSSETVPRSDITVDPGAIGPEPVPLNPLPGERVPRGGEPGMIGGPGEPNLPGIGPNPDMPPDDSAAPPGFSPLFPEDIPTALDPSFLGGGPSLTPVQQEKLTSAEDRLLPDALAIVDPGERSLALNRVAESNISGRRYDEARRVLDEASRAARAMQPGLIRDLRLISISRTYVDLAHDRVVEAVPTISPAGALFSTRDEASERKISRPEWLRQSAEEFAQAAALVQALENPNYRYEQLASIVQAQAIDSMKICNDASRALSIRRILSRRRRS